MEVNIHFVQREYIVSNVNVYRENDNRIMKNEYTWKCVENQKLILAVFCKF